MNTRFVPFFAVFFMLLSISLVPLASAQEGRASVSGIVTDQSGAAAPGAVVTVTSMERNTSSSTISGERGNYLVLFLLPGTYRVTVELPGFKKFVSENVLLQVDDKARVDAVLEVGGSSEYVVVESKGGLMETETATRGQVITSQQIADLPNNGRNIFQLVWAVPGVIKTSTYSSSPFCIFPASSWVNTR